MKKVAIRTFYSASKLNAINQYMSKKEMSLETELAETMDKIYEKHVPVAVREYIDFNLSQQDSSKKSPPKEKTKAPTKSAAAGESNDADKKADSRPNQIIDQNMNKHFVGNANNNDR